MRTTTRWRLAAAAAFILMTVASGPALADWHSGTVSNVGVAYDGSTVVFTLSGYSRNNCLCYAAWPANLCLDRTRTSFKEEYAWLLSARARGAVVNVNIDETTCKVIAMYDAD
jgi:hypothetical protein